MSLPRKAYRVAWIGPDTDSCQYVLDRFLASCAQLGYEPQITRAQSIDVRCVADQDRIVLSSVNRADYPHETIEALTISGNIVPWGVITGSWHLGSRRSGQGTVTHWQQPWFRWWDSWLGWFFPEAARPGSLTTTAFSPIVTPLDYALPSGAVIASPCNSHLAILCACENTASLLHQQATHAGWSASVCRTMVDLRSLTCPPERVMWDDTFLPCLPQESLDQAVDELLGRIEQDTPAARLITSIGAENLHLWPALQKRGCVDVLVKPGAALALSNLLFYDFSQRQLA